MENERHDTHIITDSSFEEYYDEKGNLKIDNINEDDVDEGVKNAPTNKIEIKELFSNLLERTEKDNSEISDNDENDKNNKNGNKNKGNNNNLRSNNTNNNNLYYKRLNKIKICKFNFAINDKDNNENSNNINNNNENNNINSDDNNKNEINSTQKNYKNISGNKGEGNRISIPDSYKEYCFYFSILKKNGKDDDDKSKKR